MRLRNWSTLANDRPLTRRCRLASIVRYCPHLRTSRTLRRAWTTAEWTGCFGSARSPHRRAFRFRERGGPRRPIDTRGRAQGCDRTRASQIDQVLDVTTPPAGWSPGPAARAHWGRWGGLLEASFRTTSLNATCRGLCVAATCQLTGAEQKSAIGIPNGAHNFGRGLTGTGKWTRRRV